MFQNITRRDFVNGVSLASAAGAFISPMELFAQSGQTVTNEYPPSLTGLRGSHEGSYEVAHSISWEGKDWGIPKDQTDEIYDMIVVGGGISGLSAAFLYQQKMGGGKKILILDNHDDFGGHAKRNEFDVDGKLLIGYGGSQTIQDPGKYSPEAKKLLKDISIETDKFYDYFDMEHYNKWNLSSGLLFRASDYGKDKIVKSPFMNIFASSNDEFGEASGVKKRIKRIREFPISKKGQDSLIKLITDPINPYENLSNDEKIKILRSITYIDYLKEHYDMPQDATDILRDSAKVNWGTGWDALPAIEAVFTYEPGLEIFSNLIEIIKGPDQSEPYIFHFPDGNAGITRSLVRKLIPEAVPGKSMEDLVLAKVDYSLLDQEISNTRIRLNSTVVNVQHTPDEAEVDVTYVRGGKPERVRAKHVVMACYNHIIPYICPEVPEKQIEAINFATKMPLVYTSIALRNWRAFAARELQHVRVVNEQLHHAYSLDFPVSMGDYLFSENPDQPIIVHASSAPSVPNEGYSTVEQAKMGRMNLYQTTYEDFENSIVGHFEGMFNGVDFDAERDIAAITVNRWPHGYAYEYKDLNDNPNHGRLLGPHFEGRKQIGRISIANSDSSGAAYVDAAIDAAVRAVDEQINL